MSNNIAQIIENIGADFPNGKYWNHNPGDGNDPTSVTNTACNHSNHDVYGTCGCNSYGNAIQCQGFALYLANRVFGSYPSIHGLNHQNMDCGNGWYAYAKESYTSSGQRFYDIDIEPGDIIITPSHTAMVWYIDDSDIVQVIEVWGSEGCQIHHGNYNGNWEGIPTVSHVKSIANYIVKAPKTNTPETVTVSFYDDLATNGGRLIGTRTYTVGGTYYSVGFPDAGTKTGYTFDKWYTATGGFVETWSTVTSDRTKLYAHWTPNNVRVILENYNGSGTHKVVNETYDAKYQNLSTANVGVFNHIGWFDSTGTEYTANTTVRNANVHSIKAHWRWTVYLYRNNGTANETPISLSVTTGTKYGTLLNFAANNISKPGYTFAGWYTSATGGTKIESTTDVRDGVTALYAHWTPNN